MPFEPDATSVSTTEFRLPVATNEVGAVLKPFNGPTRRFPVDYVVLDSDVSDLPMSPDDLKAGGFIA